MDETATQVKVRNYPKSTVCKCGGHMGGRSVPLPGEICKVATEGRRDSWRGNRW
jgi:hypothetical protein